VDFIIRSLRSIYTFSGVYTVTSSPWLSVTPTMRLYLPRVEARLRGITALWFCRKKGHLHTIPCNEQEWDKELAYNRHFTQYINIIHTSSKIQSYRPTTVKIQMKIRQPQMLDPRSSQLGSTTDHQEKTHSNDHVPRRTPTWDRRHHLHWHRRHLQLFW